MSEPNFKFVFHTKNGPISNSPTEQTRLDKRMEIIVRVIKSMGYENASPQTCTSIIAEMTKNGISKDYWKFNDLVSAIAKKEGC
jgi:myo-inositol catabolism protein IolC